MVVMKQSLTRTLTLTTLTLALLSGCKEESGTSTGDEIPYSGPVWADPILSNNTEEFGVVANESALNVYAHATTLKVLTANMTSDLTISETAYQDALKELVALSPDIIFTQEASATNERLAKSLNMHVWGGQDRTSSVGVLSSYPIIEVFDTLSNPQIGAVLDVNGRQVIVMSNDLDSRYNISYDIRGIDTSEALWKPYADCTGISDNETLNTLVDESFRLKQAQQTIDLLLDYKANNTPIIFGGNMVDPSGLDWTEQTSRLFDHNNVIHDFETHKVIRSSGYVDSYRELYPDPVSHPGISWPLRQADSFGDDNTDETIITDTCGRAIDDRDRVDFIYYNKEARGVTLDSATFIGPKTTDFFASPNENNLDPEGGYLDPRQGVKINSETGESGYDEDDFPSNHAWYMATFTIQTPNDSTTHASLNTNSDIIIESLENVDDNLKVNFTVKDSNFMNTAFNYSVNVTIDGTDGPDKMGGSIGINSRPEADTVYSLNIGKLFLATFRNRNDIELRIAHEVNDVARISAIKTLSWEAIEEVVAITALEGPIQAPFSTDKLAYSTGDDVVVKFHSTQGGTNDWIGVYQKDVIPSIVNAAIDSLVIPQFENSGEMIFSNLASGEYEAHLFYNDSFTVEKTIAFTIKDGAVVSPAKVMYEENESIEIFFSNTPENALDWIGLYEKSAPAAEPIIKAYTDGALKGSVVFPDGLTQGDYVVRMFSNDSFTLLSEIAFTVL
jgi:hypothetical protein